LPDFKKKIEKLVK